MDKLELEKVLPLLKLAIEEDMGQGDMTSDLFFGNNVIWVCSLLWNVKVFFNPLRNGVK